MNQQQASFGDLYRQLEPTVLDDLYHNAPVGYHSLDAEGKIMLINDTELRWIGYSREEVVGQMYLYDILPPEQKTRFTDDFTKAQQSGILKDERTVLIRKDGSNFPVLMNHSVIFDEDGQFLMTRTVVIDMTVQQGLEDQIVRKNSELRQLNEQLFVLNQTKNRFIGVVAHGLQTPITNLRLLAAKFRKTAATLTERQSQWVDEIDQTALRMSELIRQTLDVNRIERQANTPHCTEQDVLPAISELLNRFTYIAERKSIRLRLACETETAVCHTDLAYLTEILENLLSNAIKFSPAGKTVWCHIDCIPGQLCLSVSDEALGIPPDEQVHLFKPFTKLSPQPTAGEASSGLGLSVAKEYAGQIGATLSYTDRHPETGATFLLQLPV